MKLKDVLKRSLIVFFILVLITFSMSFVDNNMIFCAKKTKTGMSVNDVTGLGENTLNPSSGDIAELEVLGGKGTEADTDDYKIRYTKFNKALYKIWGVILVVLQVASICGVIFAGVRYMFASADSKADLKKSMISLVIGMIIVFGASTVVGFVTGTFEDIFKPLL